MDSQALLTIAIPTYNRVDSLVCILEKIAPFLSQKLHLLILDNHSNDGTQEYCKGFIQSHKHSSYAKHDSNLGGVVNMLRCIEFSNTTYTWLLGDDDDIEVELLEELLQILSLKNAAAYHLLASSRQRRKIVQYVFESKEEFESSFFDVTAMHLMSSNIFKTQEAKKYLADAYRVVHLQHAFSLFNAKFLENQQRLEILKLPILKPERIVLKRWSKFVAHIDAMETTYKLFGKSLTKKEYTIRKATLLKVATISLFSEKDEGFNALQINRLFFLLSFRDYFYPILFKVMFFLAIGRYRRYLLIGALYALFRYKHGKSFVVEMKRFFDVAEESSLYLFLKNNINKARSNYFKN